MDIQEFIKNLTNQFDDPESVILTPDTNFRELADWDSLTAMMTVVMADEVYGVTLPPDKMREAKTVRELFELVKSIKG